MPSLTDLLKFISQDQQHEMVRHHRIQQMITNSKRVIVGNYQPHKSSLENAHTMNGHFDSVDIGLYDEGNFLKDTSGFPNMK